MTEKYNEGMSKKYSVVVTAEYFVNGKSISKSSGKRESDTRNDMMSTYSDLADSIIRLWGGLTDGDQPDLLPRREKQK